MFIATPIKFVATENPFLVLYILYVNVIFKKKPNKEIP